MNQLIKQYICSSSIITGGFPDHFEQNILGLQKQYIISRSMPKPTIKIAYYRLRGKAQVSRLLCEFLEVNYEDKLYTYQEWMIEKSEKSNKIMIKEIPYLEEGKFRVSGSIPMCLYIIDRFGPPELLGRNIQDQGIVDMYLWTIDSMSDIINMNCSKRTEQEMKWFKENQWNNAVLPKIKKYEEYASTESWFLGYLTIIDFSIYELVRYLSMIFGSKMQDFPNLRRITEMIGKLPKIQEYENSERCIQDMCPSVLLRQIRDNSSSTATN